MAIGRIGDIINGEHFAKATNLPWGFTYTHPDSPAFQLPVMHPAVAYELLFDVALLAVLWPLRNRFRPRGMFFALYGATYSIGRFFISFLRVEQNYYFWGLNEAQVVALIVIIITVPLLIWKAQVSAPHRRNARRQAKECAGGLGRPCWIPEVSARKFAVPTREGPAIPGHATSPASGCRPGPAAPVQPGPRGRASRRPD